MWYMFLDDERIPTPFTFRVLNNVSEILRFENEGFVYRPGMFVVCRRVKDAKELFLNHPTTLEFVSLDNDLGTKEEGIDFVKFLIDYDIKNKVLPPTFSFQVHSMNTPAKWWMYDKLELYLRYKREGRIHC